MNTVCRIALAIVAAIIASLSARAAVAQTLVVRDARAYASIADAVDSCPATGCIVMVPSGSYPVTRTLNLKSRVRILGQGGATLTVAAGVNPTFRVYGRLTALTAADAAPPETSSIRVASVAGIGTGDELVVGLDGRSATYQFGTVAAVVANQVFFRAPLGQAVPAGSSVWKSTPAEGVEIASLDVRGGQAVLQAYMTRGLRINGVNCENSAAGGFHINYASGPVISGATLTGCGTGIYVTASEGPRVVGNVLHRNFRGGIVFANVTDGLISGNTIVADRDAGQQGLNGDGITFGNTWRTHVSDNTLMNTSCYGMWISVSPKNFFARNAVVNSLTAGLFLDRSNDNHVVANRFLNISTSRGILISASERNSLVDNVFAGNHQAVAVYSARDTELFRNVFSRNAVASFLASDTASSFLMANLFRDPSAIQNLSKTTIGDLF
jgi:parallel beta-helix repeat protein